MTLELIILSSLSIYRYIAFLRNLLPITHYVIYYLRLIIIELANSMPIFSCEIPFHLSQIRESQNCVQLVGCRLFKFYSHQTETVFLLRLL